MSREKMAVNTFFMASQLWRDQKSEKELIELIEIHNSLEPGLPSIPSYLEDIARNELHLQQVRECKRLHPETDSYELHKSQANLFESLSIAISITEKSHQSNVNELNELLDIQRMLQKIINQESDP